MKPRKALTTGELNTFHVNEGQSPTLPLISMKALAKPRPHENAKTKESVSKRNQQTQLKVIQPRQLPDPSAMDLLPGLLQFSVSSKILRYSFSQI